MQKKLSLFLKITKQQLLYQPIVDKQNTVKKGYTESFSHVPIL